MIYAQVFSEAIAVDMNIVAQAKNKSIEGFNTEAQLVTLFETIVGHRVKQSSSGLLTEFDCGDGIADIVLYELRKGWESVINLGNVSPRWAYALRSLPYRKSFKSSDFAASAMVTRGTAVNVLRQFVELGFCEHKHSHDTWVKIKQPRPLVNNIYAIEAKLRHWKKALTQAVRYRDYACQSLVLLDKYSVKPALENIEQFERLNIGLAAISTEGSVTIYIMPPPLPPKSEARFWQANSEIARRLISRL